MENKNKTTKFENVGQLSDYLKEGRFSNLIGNIRSVKVKMDDLCKEARAREKDLIAEQQKLDAIKAKEQEKVSEQKPQVKVEQTQPVVSATQETKVKEVKTKEIKPQNNKVQNIQVSQNQNNRNNNRNQNVAGQNNRNQNNKRGKSPTADIKVVRHITEIHQHSCGDRRKHPV